MSAGVRHQHFSVRGLRLGYHAYGDPRAAPILCLHGFMDHGLSFAFVAEQLADARHVIALDFRGFGDSDWVGAGGYYHFQDYFQDVALLIEHLNLERFSILAHSMGGTVACGVAALRPKQVTSVVLLEGMGPPFHRPDEAKARIGEWLDSMARRNVHGDVESRRRSRRPMASLADAAARLQAMNPRLPPDRAAALAATFTEPVGTEPGQRVWKADPLHQTRSPKTFLREEGESLWRAIRCPVLSIYGGDSSWRVPELEARHVAIAEHSVRVAPGAGHNVHHDRPDLVAAAVRAWTDQNGGDLPEALTPFAP